MSAEITITISRASVLADMKVKSHAEVAAIVDEKARYLAELGSEKEAEANQGITDAAADIEAYLRSILTYDTAVQTADDAYDTTESIIYKLSVSDRKKYGLAKALSKEIHAYIVDSALARFYDAVSHPELSAVHLKRLTAELTAIDNLFFNKTEPTAPSYEPEPEPEPETDEP